MARVRGPQDLPGFVPTEPVVPDTQKKYTGTEQQQRQKKGPFELIPIPGAKEDSVVSQSKESASTGSDKLPDPADPKLTFGQKLNSGLDKLFNMQENDPEAYRKVMSGFDIYLRGQRGDDLVTAITGNSKFNAEQASALLKSSLAANDLKLSEMKVLEAQRESIEVDAPSDDLKKLAGNILDKDYDIDNENIAFQIASRAKVKQRNTPGLDEATALDLAIQDAVASGELVSGKGKLGSGKFKSKVGQSKSIKEVMKAFDMSEEEARQEIIDQGFTPR